MYTYNRKFIVFQLLFCQIKQECVKHIKHTEKLHRCDKNYVIVGQHIYIWEFLYHKINRLNYQPQTTCVILADVNCNNNNNNNDS